MNKGLIDEIAVPVYIVALRVSADFPRGRRGGAELRARGVVGSRGRGGPRWPTCRWRIRGGWICWRKDARVRGTDVPLEERAPGGLCVGRGGRREADGEALSLIERRRAASIRPVVGMVVPAQIDTCTEGLLREFREGARRLLADPCGAIGQRVPRDHPADTPIGWLDLGLLLERSIIGHASSWTITLSRRAGTRIAM